ncbi:MAG TPA: tripartite tricarboxylate transporter TctB family protein [Roseovarius sp.]|uniref:tripartite tricarboxylate transporter TctB family protein n=1 Tax=Marivita sp. TaxID=2003365 RepID=UPI0025C6EC82|nr:tripartite tricarboxylate transporter TctB family protein [Marivita sp.]HKL44738.1 tripartite tricarboxylate transporter TctB family protein [Roseovarius sp.]
MSQKSLHLRLGTVVVLCALFLVFYAIPSFVFAPSNVGNIVLSPLFWPFVLAGLAGLVGAGLLASGVSSDDTPFEDADTGPSDGPAGWLRLLGLATIMVLVMVALPRLGMVWTSMLAFVACAFLFRTRHPMIAVICAIVVPLLLYAFFAHVAGVAIPQGHFVRLP